MSHPHASHVNAYGRESGGSSSKAPASAGSSGRGSGSNSADNAARKLAGVVAVAGIGVGASGGSGTNSAAPSYRHSHSGSASSQGSKSASGYTSAVQSARDATSTSTPTPASGRVDVPAAMMSSVGARMSGSSMMTRRSSGSGVVAAMSMGMNVELSGGSSVSGSGSSTRRSSQAGDAQERGIKKTEGKKSRDTDGSVGREDERRERKSEKAYGSIAPPSHPRPSSLHGQLRGEDDERRASGRSQSGAVHGVTGPPSSSSDRAVISGGYQPSREGVPGQSGAVASGREGAGVGALTSAGRIGGGEWEEVEEEEERRRYADVESDQGAGSKKSSSRTGSRGRVLHNDHEPVRSKAQRGAVVGAAETIQPSEAGSMGRAPTVVAGPGAPGSRAMAVTGATSDDYSAASAERDARDGKVSATQAASTSASSSKKPKTKGVSRKKAAQLLAEQSALTDAAQKAAALLQEKKELEARIAAREAKAREEQQHVNRVEEANRLYTEAESDALYEHERERVVQKLEEAVYEAQEWDRYLKCTPLPDVSDPAQLNAFVSVFREIDTSNPPHLMLPPAVAAVTHAERIVAELTKRLYAAREEQQHDAITYCEQYIHLLRELSLKKLDEVTVRFLNRTDEYEVGDEETFTMCELSDPEADAPTNSDTTSPIPTLTDPTRFQVGYGLWVHNSNYNRIRKISFDSLGVTIELPQSLQKARTSIRLVRTMYDHVAIVRKEEKKENEATTAAAAATTTLARPSSRGDINRMMPPAAATPAAAVSDASLPPLSTPTASIPSASAVDQPELTDPISLFDFSSHPPPTQSISHLVSVGGVLDLQQLMLPPKPKKIRSWIMREITGLDKVLVNVPYPSEDGSSVTAASILATPTSGSAASAPLRLRFTVAPHIFLGDREPMFGYWDSSAARGQGAWKTDGVVVSDYDPSTRHVSLSLPTIKPLAVVQPRALDFPYRNWSIIPVPEAGYESGMESTTDDPSSAQAHTCRLEVVGSRFNVCLEIQGLWARLYSPADPFLRHLRDDWRNVGELVEELARIGINVAPTDDDARFCRKPVKNPLLISTLHHHLSLLTQVYEVSSDRHNVSRPSNAATIRFRLNKRSVLLQQAAAKRAIMDWEAREEEAERRDQPDTTYENFPEQLRDKSAEQDENEAKKPSTREEELERQIREMELQEAKEKAEQEELERQRAAQAALEEEAAAAANAVRLKGKKAVTSADEKSKQEPAPLTEEQRYALGFEWVTVLAELIDAPSDPELAASAAAASTGTRPPPAAPSSRGKVSHAKPLSASDRARGFTHEDLPAGALLRFTIIRGDDHEGGCDTRPLPGCDSHFSLHRCLLAYFKAKTPHDLTTAMHMRAPDFGTGDEAPTAHGDAAMQYHFIPFEPITLHTQQTVRRALNLLRPFIFH